MKVPWTLMLALALALAAHVFGTAHAWVPYDCDALVQYSPCVPLLNNSWTNANYADAIASACATKVTMPWSRAEYYMANCTEIQSGGVYANCTPYQKLAWTYGEIFQQSLYRCVCV